MQEIIVLRILVCWSVRERPIPSAPEDMQDRKRQSLVSTKKESLWIMHILGRQHYSKELSRREKLYRQTRTGLVRSINGGLNWPIYKWLKRLAHDRKIWRTLQISSKIVDAKTLEMAALRKFVWKIIFDHVSH